MRFRVSIIMVATLLAAAAVVDCWAQPPGGGGGRRGGFGGGRGIGRLALLRVDAVQKELDLVDTQLADIEKLQAELRGERGRRGEGGRFGDLSDDQRQARLDQMRKEAQERAKLEAKKLEGILLEHQMQRLNEIYVQTAGTGALEDPLIAEQLKITDTQRQQIAAVQGEVMSKMREFFQSGDRDAMREKMAELRGEAEKKILATLTAEQRTAFDELKGEPFEMPADALRGGTGGRQRGGREGGDRPRRSQRSGDE